jgi:hypothetical protein
MPAALDATGTRLIGGSVDFDAVLLFFDGRKVVLMRPPFPGLGVLDFRLGFICEDVADAGGDMVVGAVGVALKLVSAAWEAEA